MDFTGKISKFIKIDNIVKKLAEKLDPDWSKTLNEDISMEIAKIEIVRCGQIVSQMTKSKVVIENVIDVGDKSSDSFYLTFFYKEVNIICGIILNQEEEDIKHTFHSTSFFFWRYTAPALNPSSGVP